MTLYKYIVATFLQLTSYMYYVYVHYTVMWSDPQTKSEKSDWACVHDVL